jgi:polysaccharide export outer membrane protein
MLPQSLHGKRLRAGPAALLALLLAALAVVCPDRASALGASSIAASGRAGGSTQQSRATSPQAMPLAPPGTGLEAAIEAASYRLGPGDTLMIGVWAPQPVVMTVGVTVEGKLIVPGVGEFPVDGVLLDAARETVRRALFKHFHDVEITIALASLRRFQIHVLGQVEFPGTYLGTAVDRVSAAVQWAGGFTENASERRIAVSADDSVRAYADLFIFLQRGIPSANPYLRDGDIIYIPFARHRFAVQGAVNEPASFEFLEGDRFSEALAYAGGFTPEAFPDSIEIARYVGPDRHPVRFFALEGGGLVPADPQGAEFLPVESGRFTVANVGPQRESLSNYPDFELQPDDILFVRAIPEYRVKRLVEIRGEVVYPGEYAIMEGESRLLDTIERAGGVTSEAFLREGTLIRREAIRLEDREYERLKNVPAADMTEDEYEYFKLRSRENPGRMVVDFHRLIAEGDMSQNLLLRSGDLITIPTARDFISVLGMVSFPGNIPYQPGWSARDYLSKAGGFAEKADKGETRVIRASTGEWVSLDEAKYLEAGDTIWVPEKRDRDWWQFFKDPIAVTTQIVTIYLVVDRATD